MLLVLFVISLFGNKIVLIEMVKMNVLIVI